jgi:phosphatidate phosphatase APP1
MGKFKLTLLALVLTILSLQVKAQILLVSDIDDTIKISHVLETRDTVENTVFIHNHFLGMAELYQALQDSHDTRFAYVSSAPSWAMKLSHQSFLILNSFPSGELLLRESIFEQNYKIKTISQLIEKVQPSHLILVGDNGEKDTLIYAEIQKTYPQLPIVTFIHQLYSVKSNVEKGRPLELGQKGFATAVDLAMQMKSMGLLTDEKYQNFVSKAVPLILKEKEDQNSGVLAFPYWMDCRDFLSQNQIAASDPLLISYQSKLQSRCAQGL